MKNILIALAGLCVGYLLMKAAGMHGRPVTSASLYVLASGLLSFAVAAGIRR